MLIPSKNDKDDVVKTSNNERFAVATLVLHPNVSDKYNIKENQ